MSITASPSLDHRVLRPPTNDRPAGNRRNSDLWDKNTRRGVGSLGMTPQHPKTHPARGHKSAAGQYAALARAAARALRRATTEDLGAAYLLVLAVEREDWEWLVVQPEQL